MLRIKLEDLLFFLVLIRLVPGFSFDASWILSFYLLRILSLWSLQDWPLKVEYMACTNSKGLEYIFTLNTITSLDLLEHFNLLPGYFITPRWTASFFKPEMFLRKFGFVGRKDSVIGSTPVHFLLLCLCDVLNC